MVLGVVDAGVFTLLVHIHKTQPMDVICFKSDEAKMIRTKIILHCFGYFFLSVYYIFY